jgi:hypothetical protein
MPKNKPVHVPKLLKKPRMPERSEALAGDETKDGISRIPAEQIPEQPPSRAQR